MSANMPTIVPRTELGSTSKRAPAPTPSAPSTTLIPPKPVPKAGARSIATPIDPARGRRFVTHDHADEDEGHNQEDATQHARQTTPAQNALLLIHDGHSFPLSLQNLTPELRRRPAALRKPSVPL